MKSSLATVVWVLAGLVLLAVVAGAMFKVRGDVLAVYGTQAAQSEWDTWRAEAKKLATEGPVKRREPKSLEPPALVLMRDYFGVSLALALVLSSVLFATLIFFIRGALNTQTVPRSQQTFRHIP